MNNIKKITFILTSIILLSTSCVNDLSKKELAYEEKTAYIQVGNNSSRTIQPKIDLYNMTAFVLSGTETIEGESEEIIIAKANSYEELISKTFSIKLKGESSNWTFFLRAKNNETSFSASVQKSLSVGEITNLAFELKAEKTDPSIVTGDVEITFNFPFDSNVCGVKAFLSSIFEIYYSSYTSAESSMLTIENSTTVFRKTDVSEGEYWFKAEFYSDSTCKNYLSCYESVVKVVAGNTSAAVIDIPELEKSYAIHFYLNGGDWVDGYVPPKDLNSNSKIELPDGKILKKEGGYFFAGWSLDNNSNGSRVKYVENPISDVNLYAQWQYGLLVSPDDNLDLSTEYGDLLIKCTGNFTNKFSSLSTAIRSYTDGKIILDMTEVSGIRKIPDEAFMDCTALKSVILPEDLVAIGKSTFAGCSDMISIDIPASVTSIEDTSLPSRITINYTGTLDQWCNKSWNPFDEYYLQINGQRIKEIDYNNRLAFKKCLNEYTVIITDGITNIGDYDFDGCIGLEKVIIPASVTTIEDEAFNGCTVNTIYYSGTIKQWCEKTWNPKYISTSYDLYIDNQQIKEDLVIPNDVMSIGGYGFSGCSKITSVTIPDSVTYISSFAFENCSVNTIYYLGTIKQWCEMSHSGHTSSYDLYIDGYQIKGDLVIPNDVTIIGYAAFSGCSGLTSVTIPDSVTSIGTGAFYGCSGLTDITIPDSVTSIESYTFDGCTVLSSVTIPANVTSIGIYAFSDCSGLTSITIPDGVTSIGNYAFSGCSGLTSITIPDGVTSIGSCAFRGCSGLIGITIPDGVTSIGYATFKGCTGLESVTIPANVTSIESFAFDGCTGLSSVTIPANVTSIGIYAFSDCSGLTSITIPDGVTSIGSCAFSGCSGLTGITIPKSVTRLGDAVFYQCDNLKSVVFEDSSGWYRVREDNSSSIDVSIDFQYSDRAATELKRFFIDSYYYQKL